MTYIFHEEAEEELNRQIDYYEEIQPGLGEDFYEEVLVTLSRIMQNPIAWQKIKSGHRRCLTNRFPYSIVYSYEKITILYELLPLKVSIKNQVIGSLERFNLMFNLSK